MHQTASIPKYLSVLLLFLLLNISGCGGSGSSGNDGSSQAINNRTCSQDYFNNNVSTILTHCVSCHSSNGSAKSTALVLIAPIIDNQEKNFAILKSYIEQTDTRVIEKGSNQIEHTGGEQLVGEERRTLERFVNYIQGVQSCNQESVDITSINTDAVTLLSPSATLRAASLKLGATLPSQTELQQLASINDLDTILDNYMKTPAFYEWLHQIFNDFLLTDFYAPGRMAEDLLHSDDFPHTRWYDKLYPKDQPDYDYQKRRTLYENVNYAIAREATGLMEYVIREDRPFSEILTADYVLVNPYSARSYGIDIEGFTFQDSDINLTIEEINQKYPKDHFKEVKLPHPNGTDGYLPSAGILTTTTYLNRFPSTNTNLDRHRSAKTQLFFFDTDILSLSTRPTNVGDLLDDTATWTNKNCTVCHNIMEPIASCFKNFTNDGRYMPGFRKTASQAPGISIDKQAPASEKGHFLQWLTKEMVKDDRFAMASVKMFYRAILGREPLKKPTSDDPHYREALQSYNYEQSILNGIKERFKSANMNAKVIIKELIKSPLFRADGLTIDNTILAKNIGQAKLITPEELNRKIKKLIGIYWHGYWTQKYSDNNNSRWHKLLQEEYRLLYGGINSTSVTKRNYELNGVMANLQLRMATELCGIATSVDFALPQKQRNLFPFVKSSTLPIDEKSIETIKRNIQYLHSHLLGEELEIGDEELEATYRLFLDTWREGIMRVQNEEEPNYINWSWSIRTDLHTGKTIPQKEYIHNDSYYLLRSWSVVIAYLLSDFKFLYENSAN